MRSYATRDADPFRACIWEVARATFALPGAFLPIEIESVVYGDGSTGFNNPTNEAIEECRSIWPDRPIGVLVSLGSGLEKSLQLKESDAGQLLPKSVESLLEKTSSRYRSYLISVADYALKYLANCELIHVKLQNDLNVKLSAIITFV
jgi:predicted acylesterase/phospholipase RssA